MRGRLRVEVWNFGGWKVVVFERVVCGGVRVRGRWVMKQDKVDCDMVPT